jgi:hypothetical protein
MILPTYTLTLEPEHPLRFSPEEFRTFLTRELAEFMALHKNDTAGFVYRYPVIQAKLVRNTFRVIGICQGASFLYQLAHGRPVLGNGEYACRITGADPEIRPEQFGTTDGIAIYEFQTPWLALNQQNAKKFYELNGKPARDAFMQKLLTAQLNTLAKSLDYEITVPISCEAKVRFRRDRIGHENVMVFLGKFRTNLQIPDYLAIGQSVSQGYGTIKRITDA